MVNKALLYGVIGFILGGLLVSSAVALTRKDDRDTSSTGQHRRMVDDLRGEEGDDFDKVFLSGMIAHHEEAIEMANLAKDNAKHEEVKKLAQDILDAQSKEISQMQTWQKAWEYPTFQSHDMSNMR